MAFLCSLTTFCGSVGRELQVGATESRARRQQEAPNVVTLRVLDSSNTERAEYKVSVLKSKNGNPAIQDATAFTVTSSCPLAVSRTEGRGLLAETDMPQTTHNCARALSLVTALTFGAAIKIRTNHSQVKSTTPVRAQLEAGTCTGSKESRTDRSLGCIGG